MCKLLELLYEYKTNIIALSSRVLLKVQLTVEEVVRRRAGGFWDKIQHPLLLTSQEKALYSFKGEVTRPNTNILLAHSKLPTQLFYKVGTQPRFGILNIKNILQAAG